MRGLLTHEVWGNDLLWGLCSLFISTTVCYLPVYLSPGPSQFPPLRWQSVKQTAILRGPIRLSLSFCFINKSLSSSRTAVGTPARHESFTSSKNPSAAVSCLKMQTGREKSVQHKSRLCLRDHIIIHRWICEPDSLNHWSSWAQVWTKRKHSSNSIYTIPFKQD